MDPLTQMEQNQFPIMALAIRKIAAAADGAQVLSIAKHFLRDFTKGEEHKTHDHGMLGIFMLKSDGLEEAQRISVSNWTPAFVTERAMLNGYTHDPSVIMVQQAAKPFTWAQGMDGADKASLAIADLCEEHTGQRNGLTFPIGDVKMLKGAATVGLDLSPDHYSPIQIGMMHHVFIAAYARLYRLQGPFPEDISPSYSPRQREIIRLLALGKSVPDAARIMGCSVSTAQDHIAKAKAKVGARTNPELIAKSIDKNVVLS